MSDRMLAKWVSMAPPCGKLADIRFMSSQKQLYESDSTQYKYNKMSTLDLYKGVDGNSSEKLDSTQL